MADININLQAQQQQFVAALQQATQFVNTLSQQIGTLQQQLQTHTAATQQNAAAVQQATTAQTAWNRSAAAGSTAAQAVGASIGKTVAFYNALYDVLVKIIGVNLISAIKDTFKEAISNIDDFNKAAIGTAAAITNIAEKTEMAGVTWNDVFNQNLAATKGIFIELEKLSSHYFASSIDLQLAYNAFAQRGVVIRRSELTQLAQLTDLILLQTQGQQSTIQVQQEIRALINATLQPNAALAHLIKSFGLDIKQISADIRATQSLKPLEGLLVGTRAATSEIQKTYQASLNGLETLVRQIGRISGEGLFSTLIKGIQNFTEFLDRNKTKIGAVAAVFGQVIADALERAEKFAEVFLNGDNITKSVTPVLELVAAVETLGSALFRVVEIAALMLRNLPRAVQAFRNELDTLNLPKEIRDLKEIADTAKAMADKFRERAQDQNLPEDQRLNAAELLKQSLDMEKQARKGIAKLQTPNAFEQMFEGLKKSAQEFFTGIIPGLKDAGGLFNAVGVAAEELLADIDKLGEFDFSKKYKENLKQLITAFTKAEEKVRSLDAVSTAVTFPARVPFKRGEEEQKQFEHIQKEAQAAAIRADRAQRTANEAGLAQDIDTQLQAQRRRLALLEQGFQLTNRGVISDLQTTGNEIVKFLQTNIEQITRGGDVNFETLANDIATVTERITQNVFKNIDAQIATARQGFENFKNQAKADQADLIADDVTPLRKASDDQRNNATAAYEKTISELNAAVSHAQGALDEELSKGANANKNSLAKLTVALKEAQNGLVTGSLTAAEIRNAQLEESVAKEILATKKENTIEAQTQLRISSEQHKLNAELLRSEQARQQVAGDAAKQLLATNAHALDLQRAAEAAKPRTDLQADLGAVQNARITANASLDDTFGKLNALSSVLTPLAEGGDAASAELLKFVNAQIALIPAIRAATDAANNEAEANARLKVTRDAVGAAADRLTSGLSDALLKSFEGVKTDFARLGKDIADNLFKDSMKNAFQQFKVSLQNGVTGMFSSLGKNLGLSEKMASALGPVFLAGFALIASFVLGSILGKKNGSSTAGNPTVGIQSTEQVRGLIGGETQIPIGLVGESLQNALIPTNLWLARIAAGIDRIGVSSGLSSTQVEAIIERSVTDALQIQPA